ncbi:MAG: F0F1 ATP synthase subunit epsilon [Bacteroidales bacterium]|nr:F0F1 ATP synthase subunit epsilon [Bacteroidales bacterium]
MMQTSFSLKVLTPVGTAFEGTVEAVFLPGTKGRFELLPGHAPIITALDAGRVVWRTGGREESLAILNGAAMLQNDTLTVCAELAQ